MHGEIETYVVPAISFHYSVSFMLSLLILLYIFILDSAYPDCNKMKNKATRKFQNLIATS
jgi:hypothetical protein